MSDAGVALVAIIAFIAGFFVCVATVLNGGAKNFNKGDTASAYIQKKSDDPCQIYVRMYGEPDINFIARIEECEK